MLTTTQYHEGVYSIKLNNPDKRNALELKMFDALNGAIHETPLETNVILLQGKGKVFCSGFDMNSCAKDVSILETYILELSKTIRNLRRLEAPVVCVAQGAAIAGGCALITGCDFVFGEVSGKYGYPVHQLGVSPAVTLPTLRQKVGDGFARHLVMSGIIIDGNQAFRSGLLSHVQQSAKLARQFGEQFATHLSKKPLHALRETKKWLNELDGSLNDDIFDAPAAQSAASIDKETQRRLKKIWTKNHG